MVPEASGDLKLTSPNMLFGVVAVTEAGSRSVMMELRSVASGGYHNLEVAPD